MPAGSALIDGNIVPKRFPCQARAIVGGDGLSLSVAAASIVAKVTRDRLMVKLSRRYRRYAWDSNKGYGTPEHAARHQETRRVHASSPLLLARSSARCGCSRPAPSRQLPEEIGEGA